LFVETLLDFTAVAAALGFGLEEFFGVFLSAAG